MVVGPWAHQDTSGAIGALDFGAGAAAEDYGVWETHLAFFDTYVRGEPRPPFDGDGRLVETFRTTADGGAGGGAGDRADDGGADGAPADAGEADGGDDVGGAVDGADDGEVGGAPADDGGTDADDADLVATLVHVTADGPAYNLCEGIRRLRYRHGRDRESPVPAGDPVRAVVDMWDVHHVVPAGDRLRLEVAASNHPRFDAHPGTPDPWRATAEEVRPAAMTLHHELDRESVLRVTRRWD